jgi:hypothetical protein
VGHGVSYHSPCCVVASAPDTTGVEERGRQAQGERGNVGEPPVSLWHARRGALAEHATVFTYHLELLLRLTQRFNQLRQQW